MMHSSKENSCRNFSPNIFNKNKCQNCFKPRETHLLSDKDLNKAKPIYCGWLLLAPIGTDFDNPVHKSRKWQRRWFVLFEHGALRYALDDNANTLPQGTINMNICSDVVHAETLTGQKHSLCIFLPEMKYFIRGENREDTLGWYDQLVVYPETAKEDARIKKKLMKKRKSVEPSHVRASPVPSKVPSITSFSAPNTPLSKPVVGDVNNPLMQDEQMDTNDTISRSTKADPTYFSMDRKQTHLERKGSDIQRDRASDSVSSESSTSNHSAHDGAEDSVKKHLKEQQTDVSKSRQFPERQHVRKDLGRVRARSPGREEVYRLFGRERRRSRVIEAFSDAQTDTSNKENNDPGLSDSSTSPRTTVRPEVTSPTSDTTSNVSSVSRDDDKRGRSISRRSTNMKQSTQTTDLGLSSSKFLRRAKSLDRKAYESITISPDLLNFKKGWLTLQEDAEKDVWTKHWFVLADQMLKYYRDSVAEDYAEADGEIKLKNCQNVTEVGASRKYGFQVHTTEGVVTLSAMTSGIRRNWINAILKSAKPPVHNQPDLTHTGDKPPLNTGDALVAELRKEDSEMTVPPTEEDLSVTERVQRRRARIRDRRKQGRSRTYDFAEFKQHVTRSKESTEAKESEVLSPDSETEVIRTRHRSGSTRASRIKRLEKNDLLASHVTDADSRVKSTELSLSPAEVKKSIDSQWQKVERLHIPLNHAKPTDHYQPGSMQEPAADVKTLQAEVDSLKHQLEKNHLDRIEMFEEAFTSGVGTHQNGQNLDDAIALNRQIQQQKIQIDNLKEELNSSTEKAREKVKELRDCGMQLDISVSEVQRAESQLSKVQNEMNMEKKRRLEAEKDYERRSKAQLLQIEESETRLKEAESQLLEAQRKIREMGRQANLQKDHQKEVENLQEQIKMLQRQTEEQQEEMSHLHEDFEAKCQSQKDLEDSLSSARDMIESYEEQIQSLMGEAQSSEKDENLRIQMKKDFERLKKEVNDYKAKNHNMRIQCEKYEAQIQLNNDCNETLQEQLGELKEENAKTKKTLLAKEQELKHERHEVKKFKSSVEKMEEMINSQAAAEQKAKSLHELQHEQTRTLLEENKKLKEEAEKEQALRQRGMEKLDLKVQELTAKLRVAEKQISDAGNIRMRSRSQKTDSSLKAKVTELEAEMEDTGQMLAARVNALETQRRRETDDSDEVGSNSSSSSLNELRRQSRKEDEKIKNLTSQLQKSENDLDAAHAKMEELMTALQAERSKSDSSSPEAQEHKGTIEKLQAEAAERKKMCDSVCGCLQELHSKVAEAQDDDDKEKAKTILPFLESVLVDTLEMLGGASLPRPSVSKSLPTKSQDLASVAKPNGDKEIEKSAADKLRMLTEKLKMTGSRMSPLSSPVLSRSQSPLASPQSPRSIRSPTLSSQMPPLPSQPIKTPAEPQAPGPDRRFTKEERIRMFAEQLSLQAMVISEMASSLERYEAEKSLDPASPLYAKITENLRELSSRDLKLDSGSNLLRHSDTLAEKLIVESHFIRELAKLRDSYLVKMKSSTFKSRSKSEASFHKTSSSKYGTAGGKSSKLQGDLEHTAALSLTHAHINYILQVYNDRICRLSHDAKEAQHRADSFQRKLRELVHACKTQDVEQVSRLAVEVDTRALPAQPLEELPPWKQQADYGTLHGAQANLFKLDLESEASFFSQLAKDVASMSSNVNSLTDAGAKIIELNGSLSRFLKPSEIGEHASTIAHEAITQAELVFLCQRIRKDYEEELMKMRNIVKQEAVQCDMLQAKLKELEEGDAARMQELTKEHQQKVDHLMAQLALVEKARVEMSSDMDTNLTRLAQKQEQEMEACVTKHKQETNVLQRDLETTRVQLQHSIDGYVSEIEKLKARLKDMKKENERQAAQAQSTYERIIADTKEHCQEKVAAAEKDGFVREKELKAESRRELDAVKKDYEKKMREVEIRRKQEIENLEKMHEKELETMNAEKKMAVDRSLREAKDRFEKERQRLEDDIVREHSDGEKRIKDLKESMITAKEMDRKVQDTKQEYESIMLTRESLHQQAMQDQERELTKKIREQVEEEMRSANSIPWMDEDEPSKAPDSGSITSSENEGRDALTNRILALEAQIETMGQQSYQAQLDEIKTLCEKSFTDIEETHLKQLEELRIQHRLEIERLQEEKEREMEEDVRATKMAIESMRRHHQQELERLKSVDAASQDKELKKQMETLSEHYTEKCVELKRIHARLEEAEDKLRDVDVSNQRLQKHNSDLAKKLESELDKLKSRSKLDMKNSDAKENAGDVYQLQVKLRVKKSEISLLRQEMEALKQQLETALQDKKYSQQKHKALFEELTTVKSRESKSERDILRLREKVARLEGDGENSDTGTLDSLDLEVPKSADFTKSKSQPDFADMLETSKPKSASVKRRSSDRTSRTKSLKESSTHRS